MGNALHISITTGKGAQYVDVDTSSRLRAISTELTFESWVAPQPQPGKIQYVGGLWGPNRDNNDSWVVYVQDTRIVFALSADGTFKGDSDNTIAIANVPDLYSRGWTHVAAVWDGVSTSARVYVDGVLMATATNPLYPITHLHPTENKLLPLQIGSSNALYDDTLTHRAFKGQIDEVRLWSRALTQKEIQCQRNKSLAGNEAGLEVYYRCNEPSFTQFLCDATGHNHIGRMRSGALCDSSGRQVPVDYTVLPSAINTKLTCIEDTTFSFTIMDTSFCGDNVALSFSGQDAGLFSASVGTMSLAQNISQTFTVHVRANLIGAITSLLTISNANRCGDPIYIPLNINRVTELNYSQDRLILDTIYSGCQDTKYSEQTITICNPTSHPITVSKVSLDSGHFTWSSAGLTLPKTLKTGDCFTITVRMDLLDTSKTQLDTLRIASDEACPGGGVIPVAGRIQDVLGLLLPNGKTRLDSMKFEEVCPGFISNPQTYQYRSLGSDTVRIDTIAFSPSNFYGIRFNYPLTLLPKNAYLATPIRFRPTVPGAYTGTAIFRARYRTCRIEKTVYFTGRGYSVDVSFQVPAVAFGNVTIGKTAQQIAPVLDSGKDPRSMTSYLKVGDVFTIVGGKGFGLNPGQTIPITVQFRPRQPITYNDTLVIFDEGCYETRSIPVTGTGIFQALSFTPSYLNMTDVVGCQSRDGQITLKNISGAAVTIISATLNDATGKFTLLNSLPSGAFADGQSFVFNVRYIPNDLLTDRADEAYIDVKLSDGELYEILLRATSVAPRLYVTPLTTYGIIEVGWQAQDSILIENESAVPERITNVAVPYGFQLLSTSKTLPCTLKPRDSLWTIVQFKPTGDSVYTGPVTVALDSPCTETYTGVVTGTGRAVKLQVPISFINYGLIKPCDCALREISLPNYSNLIPITIDSVWIDGAGVIPAAPSVFSWKRSSTGGTGVPFTLQPLTQDTLLVSFCPNIPATKANLVKNDTIHILAHTPGWKAEYRTLLSGRREMNFQPSKTLISFPATRVDTSSQPIGVDIAVPDVLLNPSADSVVIDTVTFVPDQRVFSATAATGVPLPWIILRNKKFRINVGFNPRSPKTYTARMHVHTIFPCNNADTTVLVTGTGFAPAFGLQIAFDTSKINRDTIRLTTCDTLRLPIMSSRAIPQKFIDMYFHLGYDTSSLRLIGGQSAYTKSVIATDTTDGANVILQNALDVKAGVVGYVLFVVKGGPKSFRIDIDNINFDSDSLVFFKIIAGLDHGYIIIDQPMIAISKIIAFDTVNIKQCKDQIVTVRNPGQLPIRFDSLGGLPRWHKVTASSVPVPAMLAPGDSIKLTVTFCPRDEVRFDTMITANSNLPCPILDSSHLTSFGYAPPFPFRMRIQPPPNPLVNSGAATDTISGQIGDTITVPIIVDSDIPQTPLDMRFNLVYNARSLRYLSATSSYTQPIAVDSHGVLSVTLPKCNTVLRGEIAKVKFSFAVPDSIVSKMMLDPQKFTSDSIFWVKPRPTGDTTNVSVWARCNITRLEFTTATNYLSAPSPNPSSGNVALDLGFMERASPTLAIYDNEGHEVLTLLDGNTPPLDGGSFHVEFNARRLASGGYFIRYDAGNYHRIERMMIIR